MNSFDNVHTLRYDMIKLLEASWVYQRYTILYQLFGAISKRKWTIEEPLAVNIAALRKAHNNFEILHIGLINEHEKPANGLSQVRRNDKLSAILNGINITSFVD